MILNVNITQDVFVFSLFSLTRNTLILIGKQMHGIKKLSKDSDNTV